MARDETSIADLIKGTLEDARDLVQSEIALARAELRDEITRVKSGAIAFAGAAVAAILGLVLLCSTLAWALTDLLDWPIWAGFAIVTLLLLLIAAALGYMGRARLTTHAPLPRTMETMKENAKWIRARTQ